MSSLIVYIHGVTKHRDNQIRIPISNIVIDDSLEEKDKHLPIPIIKLILQYFFNNYDLFIKNSISVESFKWYRDMLLNHDISWESIYLDYCHLGNISNVINLEAAGCIKLEKCIIPAIVQACDHNHQLLLRHLLTNKVLSNTPIYIIQRVCESGHFEILKILDEYFKITEIQYSLIDRDCIRCNRALIVPWIEARLPPSAIYNRIDKRKCLSYLLIIGVIITLIVFCTLLAKHKL